MNLAKVDDLSTRPNSVSSGSRQTAQEAVWGGLSVAIFSGWFVVTLLGLRHDLRVWDVIALRWPTAAAICVIALGGVLAAASVNQGNKKGKNR